MKQSIVFGAIGLTVIFIVGFVSGAISSPVSVVNDSVARKLNRAADYLVSNYNPTVGLVSETPGSSIYYLFSDNFLAATALSEYGRGNLTVMTIAANIAASLSRDSGLNGAENQYMVLKSAPCLFHAAKDYTISNLNGIQIKATLNNGTGELSENRYADIAFLKAICLYHQGNVVQALKEYNLGRSLFDGVGLRDLPYNLTGQYQTYKLALFIYTSVVVNQPISKAAISTLLATQAQSGGFYTGYGSYHSNEGTMTNTETTSLAILALSAVEPTRGSATERPLVGTFLYLWYGYDTTSHGWTGGLGTSHWNDSSSGLVKDSPVLGYYASLDNTTLNSQFSNMKDAGISVIAVSWWGTGNTTQSGGSATLDGAINNATLNLFRYLEATKNLWQFKVAIMVEPFNLTYSMTPHDYAGVYDYLYVHFYHPFDDLILYWQGKPLVMSFNAPWSDAGRLPTNATFTYRLVGSAPNPVDWDFWVGMNFLDSSGGTAEPQNYEHAPRITSDGEVGVAPRYDDYLLWLAHERPGYMRFDYRMNEGMYNSEWSYVLGRTKDIRLVLIYSWNEYHERTAIEPHIDANAHVNPTYLSLLTSHYVAELG